MSTCIRCGKQVPEGELFCAECSLLPLGREPEKPHKAPPEPARMRKPVPKPKPAAPRQTKAPAGTSRGVKTVLVLVSLLAAGAFALVITQALGARRQNVELRVREESLAAREAEYDSAQEKVNSLEQALDEAQLALRARDEQIEELQSGIAAAQSSANQSQYDMTTQQSELDQLRADSAALQESVEALTEENETLTEERDTLQEENEALTEERDALKETQTELQEKASFMDSYVVFVEDDKSSLYHRYACSAFKKKSFWAYSRKLAENYGYKPCPKCFG